MKSPHVVRLSTLVACTQPTLTRIVAQQGFHTTDLAPGRQSNVLRIVSGTVLDTMLFEMHVVYVSREGDWIAEPDVVRRIDGQADARDLVLGPFMRFMQTGEEPIIEMGVHLLLGPTHRHIPHHPRSSFHDRSSYAPMFLPRLP